MSRLAQEKKKQKLFFSVAFSSRKAGFTRLASTKITLVFVVAVAAQTKLMLLFRYLSSALEFCFSDCSFLAQCRLYQLAPFALWT